MSFVDDFGVTAHLYRSVVYSDISLLIDVSDVSASLAANDNDGDDEMSDGGGNSSNGSKGAAGTGSGGRVGRAIEVFHNTKNTMLSSFASVIEGTRELSLNEEERRRNNLARNNNAKVQNHHPKHHRPLNLQSQQGLSHRQPQQQYHNQRALPPKHPISEDYAQTVLMGSPVGQPAERHQHQQQPQHRTAMESQPEQIGNRFICDASFLEATQSRKMTARSPGQVRSALSTLRVVHLGLKKAKCSRVMRVPVQ